MTSTARELDWTRQASEVFARLKEEAGSLGDDFIAGEHLLLALLHVTQQGFPTTEAIRAAILARRDPRPEGLMCITPFCQTPHFEQAVLRAMDRARSESRAVNCRDLASGMLADDANVPAQILAWLGVASADFVERIHERG